MWFPRVPTNGGARGVVGREEILLATMCADAAAAEISHSYFTGDGEGGGARSYRGTLLTRRASGNVTPLRKSCFNIADSDFSLTSRGRVVAVQTPLAAGALDS